MKTKLSMFILLLIYAGMLFAQDTPETANETLAVESPDTTQTSTEENILPKQDIDDDKSTKAQSEFSLGLGGGFNRLPIVSSTVGLFLINLRYNFWFTDHKDDPLKFGIGINIALLNAFIPIPQLEATFTFPFVSKRMLMGISVGAMYDLIAADQLFLTGKMAFIVKKHWSLSLFVIAPMLDATVEYGDTFAKPKEIAQHKKEDKNYGKSKVPFFVLMISRRLGK